MPLAPFQIYLEQISVVSYNGLVFMRRLADFEPLGSFEVTFRRKEH